MTGKKAASAKPSTKKGAESATQAKHRTAALNLTHVPNYPKKLVVYQLAASPFWWTRYYADGKILRRSTKTANKRDAIEFAKGFYDEVNFKQRQGLVLNSRADFEMCATALLEQQDAMVARGEMSAMMQQNDRYRYSKEVRPFFKDYDLKNIDYFLIEKFINKLSADKLTAPTISSYLGFVRKTLSMRTGLFFSSAKRSKSVKDDGLDGRYFCDLHKKTPCPVFTQKQGVWGLR